MSAPWSEEGSVPVDGGHLHWVSAGEGTPLVLLPKLGGWVDDFLPLAAALPAGIRLVAVDAPGHGESSMDGAPPWAIPIEESAVRLLALLAALDLEGAVIGGNSLGGCIALGAAALSPESVHGLVLISCATGPAVTADALRSHQAAHPDSDYGPDGLPVARDFEEMKRRNGNGDRAVHEAMNRSRARAGAWIQPSERGVALADFPAMLRRAAVPTLLLYGAADPLDQKFAADALANLADGRVVRVPGSGRFPHQEAAVASAAIQADFIAGPVRAALHGAG